MDLDYTAILTTLGHSLSVVRDGSGPVQTGQLVRLHVEPKTLDLKVPMLLDGKVDLSFLTKSVRFADAAYPSAALVDYLKNAATILGGMPVPQVEVPMEGPTLPGAIPPAVQVNVGAVGPPLVPPRVTSSAPDVQIPAMAAPAPTAANALSGVPGLLGELAGTIPIPALVPVQLSVTWNVTRLDHVAVGAGDFVQTGSGPDVMFLFFGAIEELTTTQPTPRTFLVTATVTLSVPGTMVTLDLPPVPLVVPAIPIPTIALLSNKTNFGTDTVRDDDDNARMVMVPGNSRVEDRTSLMSVLNDLGNLVTQLTSLPTPPSWSPGLLGTVGTLIDLVKSYVPVGDRYPLPVVQADQVGDTSDIKYSSSFWGTDDFDEEDESVLVIGIPGTKFTLTTGDNLSGDRMDIVTGTEMFVIVNDLGKPTVFQPTPLSPPPSGYRAPSVSNTPSVKNSLESLAFNKS